ncbi:MAG: sensor histidine kinase [Acidimicrobiales bacterium]
MIGRFLERHHLRRVSLRVRLTVLYTGLIGVFVIVVLGVAGLLIQRGSTSVAPYPNGVPPISGPQFNGRHFAVGAALVALVAVCAAVAVAVAWWVAGRFLRPLREMNESAREIFATNLHRRLGVAGPDDELTELGRTLDGLFGRLEGSFETQRRFVANASHELRTPLAGQHTLLQVALADPDASSESLRLACEEVLALGERQERLIDSLLTLASGEQGIEYREPLDLAMVVEGVVASRRELAARVGVVLQVSLALAPASGDTSLLESLVANLLDNALEYNVPGGTVEMATSRSGAESRVAVTNTGPVVAAVDVGRLFGAFQRLGTDRTSRSSGHGLGLAIVKAIADAHGAVVTAVARPEGGLHVVVSLPDVVAPAG